MDRGFTDYVGEIADDCEQVAKKAKSLADTIRTEPALGDFWWPLDQLADECRDRARGLRGELERVKAYKEL